MTKHGHYICVATLLLATALPSFGATPNPEPWDQWRGPRRDGSVAGPAWPDSFAGLRPVWRVELGKGYPGPIVADDRVFVVESVDNEAVAVRALSRDRGRELWGHSWRASGDVPFFAAKNGDWVRSTPLWDGERLYVGDMEEVLRALDGATGEVVWKIDFPATFDTDVPDFGFVSSPLVDGDDLYVQAANSIVKLDRRTGDVLWRSLAGSDSIGASGAFSSPIVATLADTRQLVVQDRHVLHGVDLADGDVLWSQPIENFRGMMILTPVVVGDRIFTSTYKGRSHLFEIGRQGDGFAVREVWNAKGAGYMSTPVVIDDHAFMHLGNGRIDCIDLASGASRWRTSESYGDYWSMAFQNDKIIALDENGMLYLIRANTEQFELVDSRKVGEASWGHVAVSGNEIFVRELEGVTAFRWTTRSATSEAP